MAKTAINLYSVRALDERAEAVIDRVADAGYDGVQFSGRHTPEHADPETIAERLDERDLDATPAHIGMDALRDDPEEIIELYETVGVDAAVIPGIDSDNFQSAEAVDEIAAQVNALAENLDGRGWDLHYHNHAHEYVDLGDEWAFERFIDATDVGIELDVGWALVGGDDPAARIRSLGDRAELLHMKDMDTSVERGFVEIGEGDVDMQACADAAREVGTEWLVYEHDDPENPAETIEHGARYLNELR